MTNKRGQIYERNVRHAYRKCPVPAFRIFHFQDGGNVTNPAGPASEVQKQSNAPVTGKTLATKVSKSHAMPPYVPGVNPPGMAADKCITALFYEIIYLKRFLSPIR